LFSDDGGDDLRFDLVVDDYVNFLVLLPGVEAKVGGEVEGGELNRVEMSVFVVVDV